ncbi:MAG: T9SS type A sorting domain-containing protein [Flavobacterium sp.]|uniref:T9SS type A sorting domain-containing protein n=3 Tax=Flavobacterium sp. TaxID=239 RepID=UPI0022C1A760|nr:T9SS type A sorting domain-containing protein [Flavobacterium sp.]MCZ8296205.1 T9SS type A sorting domain-containing protein [Flavobacterium sp.]
MFTTKYSVSIVLIFLMFFSFHLNSQNLESLKKKSIWLKGNDLLKIDSVDVKNILNYNLCIDFVKQSISKKYNRVVTKRSTVFFVLKDENENKDEQTLFYIENRGSRAVFSNEKIVHDNTKTEFKKKEIDAKIISYSFDRNSAFSKKGSLVLEDPLFRIDNKNRIAEIIYVPEYLNNSDKLIFESYLSLKYGISLDEGTNYFNSKGEKIWDYEQNRDYGKHITGIGKDTLTGLNQKQSKNIEEDGVSIGLGKVFSTNSKNKAILDNNDFLIWGDNGESFHFKESENLNFLKTNRIWKVNTLSSTSKKFTVQILFDKNKLSKKSNGFDDFYRDYWLAIDSTNSGNFNTNNAKLVRGVLNEKNEIVFQDVKLNSNSSYLFTLVKLNSKSNAILKTDLSDMTKLTESLTDTQVTIYPNPTKTNEFVNIDLKLNNESRVNVEIIDVGGRIIRTRELGTVKNLLLKEIFQVSGTYVIQVNINGAIKSYKVIVN